MDLLKFTLNEIEEFIMHKIRSLYLQPGGLKEHYLLLFTTDKMTSILVKQESLAHVMMHAVSQRLAERVPVLEAICIVADGYSQMPENIKTCKIILYLKKASYVRTYRVDFNDSHKMILNEIQEHWFKPDELPCGFSNPFNSQELASKVPKVDLEIIYKQISKEFAKDRKKQSKQMKKQIESANPAPTENIE
ncbi:hypothetical protein SS50377_20134 [Spironucleus salmonicida]|uniref:Uncharacterized protein n=1 Tax=Spironucleus salmonicida TaxID=348837 RepID=V6LKP3_9EUKA|nr:hypothetical protein SS50377_20134 [Spironucleus salmonicida]|eukprot:EST45190.1 Hypothetical protein SS50377_14763 [Spironucleus salmonicida]